MSNLNIPGFPAYTNPTGNEYPVIAYNIHLFKKKGDPEDSKKPSSEAKTDVDEFLNNIKECGFNGTIWTPANITEEYYICYDDEDNRMWLPKENCEVI